MLDEKFILVFLDLDTEDTAAPVGVTGGCVRIQFSANKEKSISFIFDIIKGHQNQQRCSLNSVYLLWIILKQTQGQASLLTVK